MKKIYIDISHINGWNGMLTGIERVEFNLIKHYYNNTRAEFICWNNESLRFNLVSRKKIEQSIIKRTSETELAESMPASNTIFSKAKKRIKRIGGSAKTPLPEGTVIVLAGLWDNQGYIKMLLNMAQNREVIHVVYDMIPLTQQGYVVDFLPKVFGDYMYKILPHCKAILAISESTASDTRRVLGSSGLNVPDIMTFRLGDELDRASLAQEVSGLTDEFALSVGTIEARKNHMLLYYAYKKMLANSKTVTIPKLVIAGKRGWLSSDFQYIIEHDTEVKDKIIIKDSVTDSELRWLYENCIYTVFPSFYEGWGLPIAESLGYGKVTLSSDSSSMPEVGKESADYFSPFSADELEEKMNLYNNKSHRTKREKFIKDTYSVTMWSDASIQFETIVNKLMEKNN